MEEAECKIDSLNSNIPGAFLSLTCNPHIIKSKMLELLQCPRGEHQPRENGVDQEDEGVGDSSSHARSRVSPVAYSLGVVTDLLWNFPQALHTAEQVAAPQHEAANVTSCQ